MFTKKIGVLGVAALSLQLVIFVHMTEMRCADFYCKDTELKFVFFKHKSDSDTPEHILLIFPTTWD